MKFQVPTLVLSLFFTSYAVAEDQTDSLNMTGDAVTVIKKYNGRWKGWADGCVNCDKPLSVTLHKKKKVKEEVPKPTVFRAPIKQGYCECNCKPLKDLKEQKTDNTPKKEAPAEAKPEKE